MSMLMDGFSTTITFLDQTGGVTLWEKTVTPPGMSMGGSVDITTMRTVAWRVRNSKALKDFTEMSGKAAYDPIHLQSLQSVLGVNQRCKTTFPDTQFVTFWGYLEEFKPDEHKEGDQPTAAFKVTPTNHSNTTNNTTGFNIVPPLSIPPSATVRDPG